MSREGGLKPKNHEHYASATKRVSGGGGKFWPKQSRVRRDGIYERPLARYVFLFRNRRIRVRTPPPPLNIINEWPLGVVTPTVWFRYWHASSDERSVTRISRNKGPYRNYVTLNPKSRFSCPYPCTPTNSRPSPLITWVTLLENLCLPTPPPTPSLQHTYSTSRDRISGWSLREWE